MKAALANAGANVMLFKLSIARFFLFVIGTLCSSSLAALSGMEWAEATVQTKIMVCIGIGGSFCATIGAFLDQSIKRAAEGKDPITGATPPIFASQKQVDEGLSTKTMVSPATLANTPMPAAKPEGTP